MSNDTQQPSQLEKLLTEGDFLSVPKLGDLIKGKILSTKGREVRVDVSGLTTGIVRGRELFTEGGMYNDLKPGDEVEATVIGLENENGEVELSFRYAGHKKSWEDLKNTFAQSDTMEVKVIDANKGGLLVKANHLTGFLPVSQLAPEHYPRVSGGDKQKILEKLKEFIDTKMRVKILDLNEGDEKLIFSEKSVWESEQKNVISQIAVGDIIEGTVTALADFGSFVKFFPDPSNEDTALEGLVHISEIAWQRIDHPKDLLKVSQNVRAQIIGIEGSKIFLSMKKLIDDPWKDVAEKYKIGDIVEGKILKINPFGFFIELDQDIHGLAHVSELSAKPVEDIHTLGSVGEVKQFKIVSIEPKDHRLGLSIKAMSEKSEPAAEEKTEDAAPAAEAAPEETKEDAPAAETEEVKEETKA